MAAEGYSWREYTDINFISKMHDYMYWAGIMASAGLGLIFHAAVGMKAGEASGEREAR